MNSVEKLYRDGAYYKFNGIIECVKFNLKTEKVIERLTELKTDTTTIAGHFISDFSIAALDILNIEKYTGNNKDIKKLIKCELLF